MAARVHHRRTWSALVGIVAATLAATVLTPPRAAQAEGTAASCPTTEPSSAVSAYAPAGTQDVALGSTVTSSSSYQMSGEGWNQSNLVDGLVSAPGFTNGWSTNPYDRVGDPATPAWVQLALPRDAQVQRIVLFPRGDITPYGANFPARYTVTATDPSGATTFSAAEEQATAPTAPVVIDLGAPVLARTIRIDVSLRYAVPSGGDGYLVQLAEIAAFGNPTTPSVSISKPALLLKTGSTDRLSCSLVYTGEPPTLTWTTSNPRVATVGQDGTVTAVAPGKATITLSTSTGLSDTAPVTVADHIEMPGDHFLISVFWPPTKDFVNDAQYRNLAHAGIDFVQNNDTGDLTDKSTNLKMAALAYKYGMQVGVADSRSGANLLSMSDAQITSMVDEYKDVPGVGGYYVIDEPGDPNPYVRVYNDIKREAPDYYAHVNFLPSYVYGSEQAFQNTLTDWASKTGDRDYLMYDRYPFGLDPGSLDYQGMLSNMNSARLAGLATGTKTATYLQAVGVQGGFRRPNAAEIRYEANVALAYGFKELSYFTWWTPTNRGQQFTDAIMTADGQRTDLYRPVRRLNRAIHELGPTLMRLDAEQVFLNGDTFGQQPVPADFFVHAPAGANLTLSYLRDRQTGRNYLMVVNNSFTGPQDVTLTFDPKIRSLRRISRENGRPLPVALEGHHLTLQLDKGEGQLFELPAGFDYGTGAG